MKNDYLETMPASWRKKYPSEKLQKLISDPAQWIGLPLPDSKEGRKILKRNDRLFQYCMTLEDMDYAIEPANGGLFELVPPDVCRQGFGISADPWLDMLSLDLYFFPCDYTSGPLSVSGAYAVRVPVFSTRNIGIIDPIVKRYFPGDRKSAVIPFSPNCFAELEGLFLDHPRDTASVCRKAVENGTDMEKKNCRLFLEFVRELRQENKALKEMHHLK